LQGRLGISRDGGVGPEDGHGFVLGLLDGDDAFAVGLIDVIVEALDGGFDSRGIECRDGGADGLAGGGEH
jgi:hypothetical protein